MDIKAAKKILKKVEQDYDLIAKEWGITRERPRAYQAKMVQGVKKGDKVLDLGCGNSVLYDVLGNKSIEYVGVDISAKLLTLAKKRIKENRAANSKTKIIKGSITNIPLKDKDFNWVLALAVLHHIASKELQQKSVEEIYRVLKPGGKAIVTVWNLFSVYATDRFKIKEHQANLPSGWENKDLLTPWKATPTKIVQRFLYQFDKKELRQLFKKAGFKKIEISYGDAEGNKMTNLNKAYNIVVRAQK